MMYMDNLISTIKAHLVTLDGNNTMRSSLPLLSLGEVTARYEPKTKDFCHCKNHRSSWPNKTHNLRELQGYEIMHIRDQKKLK